MRVILLPNREILQANFMPVTNNSFAMRSKQEWESWLVQCGTNPEYGCLRGLSNEVGCSNAGQLARFVTFELGSSPATCVLFGPESTPLGSDTPSHFTQYSPSLVDAAQTSPASLDASTAEK